MTGDVVVLALVAASAVYFIHHLLILAGLWKSPLLRMYEKYGDEEPFYYPLPGLLIALAGFALGFGHWAAGYIRAPLLPLGPALLVLGGAWVAHHYRDVARQHPEIFQTYPRWLHTLRQYTSREERRRIAYRWLWLPWRARLHYNSSDRAFLLWADMIVLTTLS